MNTLPSGITGLIPRIPHQERRDVLGALTTLFGIMVGHALLETARDALFLGSMPAARLPWAYLAIAGAALVLGGLPQRFVKRISPRNELGGWLWLAAAVTFGFWALTPLGYRWVLFALYVWTGVLATLIVVRFWIALGDLFTLTQAKRVFPLIGAGSVLGAIVGAAVARVLTAGLPEQHLVLAAAVTFLATSGAPRLLRPAQRTSPLDVPRSLDETTADHVRTILAQPYLRRVGATILLATITFTLVDFVFKSVADRTIPAAEMGEFFSSVYLTVNVIALVVQFFLVSRLVRNIGVNTTQMIVPALLVAGGLGFSVFGGLFLAVVFKGIDGGLRHSVYRTTTELLFIPLSMDLRSKVKPLMDVVGQRGGQAIASLLILVGVSFTSNEVLFAAIAIATAGTWLYLTRDIRKHYINVFRQTLSEDITDTRIEFPALDMASLETLLSTLNVADDRRVIAALDLLVAQAKTAVIPGLILYHPSSEVVVHALNIFVHTSREDVLPIVSRLTEHTDSAVRAASVRFLSVNRRDEDELLRALDDDSPDVRATALVGLVAGGWLPDDEAQLRLKAVAKDSGANAQIAMAHAVFHQPAAVFEQLLILLAQSTDPEVQQTAVRAMGMVRSTAFVPILLDLLSQRSLRQQVRVALVALSPQTLDYLSAALRDTTLPHRIRRHLPRAISEFPAPDASTVLADALATETDGMIRFKILRALGRLQSEHPGLIIPTQSIDQAIEQTVNGAFMLMRWKQALLSGFEEKASRRTPSSALLAALIGDKEGHSLERICRLLNLRWNTEDYLRVHRGLLTGDRMAVANSRELVEQLVQPPLKNQLLLLIDDLHDPEQHTHNSKQSRERHLDYQLVVREIVESSMESLSCIATHHIGELSMSSLSGRLVERDDFSSFHREVTTQARQHFAGGTTTGV